MPVGNPVPPVLRVSPKLSYGKTSFINARFNSPEQAVAYASAIFNPASISDDFEIGGNIVKAPDGYYFTFTLGDKETGTVSWPLTRPAGHENVALWHSHGAPVEASEYFSETDFKTMSQIGLPMYMVDGTGTVRVIDDPEEKLTRVNYPVPGIRFKRSARVARGRPATRADGQPYTVRDAIGEPLFPGQEKGTEAPSPSPSSPSPSAGAARAEPPQAGQ